MHTIELALEKVGFLGCAFVPESPYSVGTIVLTGSDGGIENAKYAARLLAERGMLTVAVGYFNTEGVPADSISEIPLEYIESAINWLKQYGEQHVKTIGIYGISKGAEYALVASTLFPDLERVVALVPNYFVAEGLRKGRPPYTGVSSWKFRGTPLPYAPMKYEPFLRYVHSLRTRQNQNTVFYERTIRRGVPKEALIPIEKSCAQILLVGSEGDSIWLSRFGCEQLKERLDKAGYPHRYRYVNMTKGSHFISPMPKAALDPLGKTIRAERERRAECDAVRQEVFELAVDWLLGK